MVLASNVYVIFKFGRVWPAFLTTSLYIIYRKMHESKTTLSFRIHLSSLVFPSRSDFLFHHLFFSTHCYTPIITYYLLKRHYFIFFLTSAFGCILPSCHSPSKKYWCTASHIYSHTTEDYISPWCENHKKQ